MNAPAPPRPPLTDSPWFWAYLFGTAALIALLLGGPKYLKRQPELERQFFARQHAGQIREAGGGDESSTPPALLISLRPLYATVGLVLILAWTGLWYQRHWRRRDQAPPSGPPANPPPES